MLKFRPMYKNKTLCSVFAKSDCFPCGSFTAKKAEIMEIILNTKKLDSMNFCIFIVSNLTISEVISVSRSKCVLIVCYISRVFYSSQCEYVADFNDTFVHAL